MTGTRTLTVLGQEVSVLLPDGWRAVFTEVDPTFGILDFYSLGQENPFGYITFYLEERGLKISSGDIPVSVVKGYFEISVPKDLGTKVTSAATVSLKLDRTPRVVVRT